MAKILVVEDEPDLRETIVDELNDEGHLTIEAGNGLEGLEKLAGDSPDMIISDITMPKMNGYQFFRSVKERFPEHEFTPFIFLSALSDRESQLKGLRLGVDDYLTKPVDFGLLLTKVELNVRRHIAQAKRIAFAEAQVTNFVTASSNGASGPTQTQSLDAILQRPDCKVLAAKFETLPTATLQTLCGDQWSDMSSQILEQAEATIREHLAPNDVLHVTDTNDLLICFAELAEDKLEIQTNFIRDAIWECLFKQTNNEDLASVHARCCAFAPDLANVPEEAILPTIDQQYEQEKEIAGGTEPVTLLQSYQQETLFAQKLLTPANTPSKVKILTFEKGVLKRNRKLMNEGRYDNDFLLKLHEVLFKRLREKRAFREAFAKAVMLLPIRFQMIHDEASRARTIELCQELEKGIGATIIIELIETPDRFRSALASFSPLPVGRQLQFVEMRRLEQLGSLELGQLGELGVAFFSMRFEHVVQQEKEVLRHLIQTFEGHGIKFCIKEIPQDRLDEALDFNAHLYSTQ
jgi:DNA-binding response OmpR family regulator